MKRLLAFLLLLVLLLCGCQSEATDMPTILDPDADPWGVGTLLETDYPAWVSRPTNSMVRGQVIISINTGDSVGLNPGNFLLTNAEGETLCRKDGIMSGTMGIFHTGGGLSSFGLEYTLADSDSFVFEPADPSKKIYLKWSYGFSGVSLCGTNIRRVELQKDQVLLFGEDMSYILGFSGNWYTMYTSMNMSGEGEREAKMISRKGQEQVLFQSLQAPFTVECNLDAFTPEYVSEEVVKSFSAGQTVLASLAKGTYTIKPYHDSIVLPIALSGGAALIALAALLLLCRKKRRKNTPPAEPPQDGEA